MESPLSEVVRDQRINTILENISRAVREGVRIEISPKDVRLVQRSFAKALVLGERRLYDLAEILTHHFAPNQVIRTTLIVLGRCPDPDHSTEVIDHPVPLTQEELRQTTDSILATQHTPICPRCGKLAEMIASYVRHEPAEMTDQGILLFLLTRIKMTYNIAYKVTDMVFGIDHLFRRDKIYSQYGQVMTDVYGIKLIVRNEPDIQSSLKFLWELPSTEILEEKDYTGHRQKKSGFEAYKVVLRREKQVFEIQIQSERMYSKELKSQMASHQTYKERLRNDRKKLGKEYQLVYEALNRLLAFPGKDASEIEPIALGSSGKGLDDDF